MGRRKKRISLGKDPQLTLSKQYRKKDLDPVQSLKNAMIQANSRDIIPYTNSQNDSIFAEKHKDIAPVEVIIQLTKEYRKRIDERIRKGWHYNRLSKELIHHPKDLTVRELAFVSSQLGIRLDTLIEKVQDGFVPENVKNHKAAHYAEKIKREAAEERISELLAELKEKNQTIKELHDEKDRLHEMAVRGGRNSGEDSRVNRSEEIDSEKANEKANPEGIAREGIGGETMESRAMGGNVEIRTDGDSTGGDSEKTETPIRTSVSEDEIERTYKGPLA